MKPEPEQVDAEGQEDQGDSSGSEVSNEFLLPLAFLSKEGEDDRKTATIVQKIP